jgi:hypothetical protein
MADYDEQVITGRRWKRGCRVIISNPLGEQPQVYFQEELVTEIGGARSILPAEGVAAPFVPSAMIDLIDPDTLQPMGVSMPQSVAHAVLFSLYIKLARERDAREASQSQT